MTGSPIWASGQWMNHEPKSQGRLPAASMNDEAKSNEGLQVTIPSPTGSSGFCARAKKGCPILTDAIPPSMHKNLCKSMEHVASPFRMKTLQFPSLLALVARKSIPFPSLKRGHENQGSLSLFCQPNTFKFVFSFSWLFQLLFLYQISVATCTPISGRMVPSLLSWEHE